MERGILETHNPNDDKPMAAKGLTSYRYHYGSGYIMIGAMDDAGAMREAARSFSGTVVRENLEIWNGTAYEKVSCP